jgi:hypothetical protein
MEWNTLQNYIELGDNFMDEEYNELQQYYYEMAGSASVLKLKEKTMEPTKFSLLQELNYYAEKRSDYSLGEQKWKEYYPLTSLSEKVLRAIEKLKDQGVTDLIINKCFGENNE